MRAREAATAAGVTVKALRYYEQAGLLRPARLPNGYRDYTRQDVRLAMEIRELRSLGLAPQETQPFLECLRDGHKAGDDCPESLVAYQHKIDRLDGFIARLIHTREQLARQMLLAGRRGFRTHPHDEQPVTTPPRPDPLPADLPTPEDDGAARHLPGRVLPPLTFHATDGERIRLDEVSTERWVLYLYPLTGEPGVDIPQGWNDIPGARGCSQQACDFRDNLAALRAQGVRRVLALSTDRAEYQQDLARRLHLPYPMLSDPRLSLASALNLPTFRANAMTLYKRLTMVVWGDTVEKVFYPIFPPDKHAGEVLRWLVANPAPCS